MTTKVTYKLSAFDKALAASGRLCIMVSNGYFGDTISNIDISTSTDANGNTVTNATPVESFKGAGICTVKSPVTFGFIVKSISYTFDGNGYGVGDNAKFYKLMMGELTDSVSSSGSAVMAKANTVVTLKPDGDIATTTDYTPTVKMIDSLNVRDQFAIQALMGILDHIPDPAKLSDNEIGYYCSAAYQWASSMMTLSADTRSTFDDTTVTKDAKTEEVGVLGSNTEKLLNNIIVAIEKSDATINDNGSSVNAERVTIPELTSILKSYVKKGSSTVGLSDLIDAIKSLDVTGWIKGYSSVYQLADTVYNIIKPKIDARINEWLESAKVVIDDNEYSLTINTPA